MTRKLKTVVLVGGGLALVAVFLSPRGVLSYVRTSGHSVQRAIQDNIPTEFELQRARDLLDRTVPEMHANIRLIAEEEIEVAQLQEDIKASHERLSDEQARIARVRSMLETPQPTYAVHNQSVSHDTLREDLARRFERFKEARLVLDSKQRLLEARQASLTAARDRLDQMRAQKALLQDKIDALESQHRLVQAASLGSKLEIDDSAIAQTEKLIGDIRKRLDVAERVLAHEARFTQPIPLDTVSDADLLAEVDEYFAAPTPEPEELAVAGQPSSSGTP